MSTEFIPPHPDPTKPGSLPPNKEIPIKPSPWDLKSKSWMFVYRDGEQTAASESQADTSINPNNAADILQGVLSPGSYHPMESIHPEALRKLGDGTTPQLSGIGSSLKILVIIRYEDTPVGPYDELIVAPGFFVNPHTGKKNARITNIYVSSDASVWNGRRNWNIPKHRARFVFEPAGKRDQIVKIYHPEGSPAALDSSKPFFTAVLQGSSIPYLPLPKVAMIALSQPPLATSRYPSDHSDAAVAIATDNPKNGRENPWLMIAPSYKGSWGLAYISKLDAKDEDRLEEYGDGISFPKMNVWSAGSYFEGIICFPASKVAS